MHGRRGAVRGVLRPLQLRGARGTADFQRFDGNLAMIRISNTAKYTAAFTPTTTYGVESDTKLFLGTAAPLIDAKGHAITNHGVTTSGAIPATYTVRQHLYGYSGGGNSSIYVLDSDYPSVTSIPVGAIATVSGQLVTVTNVGIPGSLQYFNGNPGHIIDISPTVGNIFAGTTITFTWQA